MVEVAGYSALSEATRLLEAGKPELAAQHVMGHLRRNPDEPRGLAMLGAIAREMGALHQAEHFYRNALARGAQSLETRLELATVIQQQERLAEALQMFDALSRESSMPSIRGMKSIILEKLGRHDESLELRRTLASEFGADRPDYWVAYGHSLRASGQVDEAISAYRKSTEIDYEFGDAWWGLASIKRPTLTDADMDTIREALKIAIDIRNSAPLQFALARALQDRGRHEEAFHHFTEANRLRAESLNYESRELTEEVAEMKNSIDASFVASLPKAIEADVVPVFIVSLPRSGSTLLEQMIGSHPDVEPVGELTYIPAMLRSAMELATRAGATTVAKLVRAIPDELARNIGADYLRRVQEHRKTDRRYFVDKLPHNWSNILFIRKILPQAKFIDIRRNPMDCCFSNFSHSFSSAHASSFALKDIGQCYVDYVALMKHLDAVAPGLVHHIVYEDLVADPEPNLRATLDYLGLEWDPAVLEFHKLDRVVRTPSSEQVRRPLNREGIDVWRNYEEWLGPLKEVLGPLANS